MFALLDGTAQRNAGAETVAKEVLSIQKKLENGQYAALRKDTAACVTLFPRTGGAFLKRRNLTYDTRSLEEARPAMFKELVRAGFVGVGSEHRAYSASLVVNL